MGCVLPNSLGSLLESNATLNVSLDRLLIYSSNCSNMNVQKLQSDRSDQKLEITFDFLALAKTRYSEAKQSGENELWVKRPLSRNI